MIAAYYGNSDWTDTPTPMLSHPDKVGAIPKATMPTLESHIYVEDTTEGRHLVAKKTPLPEPADDEDHTVACHRFRELEVATGTMQIGSVADRLCGHLTKYRPRDTVGTTRNFCDCSSF